MKIMIRTALIFLFFLATNVFAQTCTNIFSNGFQAHSTNGNVSLSYRSSITNGSANIASKTITDNSGWLACSGSSCASTGVPSTTSTPTFLTSSGANGSISVGYQAAGSFAAGQYTTVSVGQQATLNFTTASGVYRTQGFTTNYQSIVNLQSGDYWINGNLTIGQATQLRRIATSGTTRIFVNGNINFGFQASTQSFSSNQLLIYATGTITTNNEVNLKAYLYAGGSVSLDYKTSIEGAIAGSSISTTGNEISVNYTGANLTSVDFSPFCSGGYVPPTLLGAWNMDERIWTGAANEVVDSSGNNNHGRARLAVGSTPLPTTSSGNPAYTSGNQSTCYYGEFDKTANPSRTHSYVELTGFPALPQGFTFAAWIRSTNASAQHQRILVRDDAQNGWGFSLSDGTGQPILRFFNRNVTNNGAVTGQGSNPNCGVFCIDTNAVISSNVWHYVAAVVDTSAKTVTLYVYDQSRTLLAKTTGAYSGTWQDGSGLATIGGESSVSSEGQQSSWHFLGNIDEVKIYSGAVTQATLETLMQTVRTCAGPDHYELQVNPLSIACEGTAITVRACANSVVPCAIDQSVNSSVALATSTGSLVNASLTLSAGQATTYLTYPSAANGAVSTVTLSNEQVSAINSRKCCSGSSNCSVANSCVTTFNQAGFVFSSSATSTVAIPNQVAGTLNPNVYLRALTTDQTTGACVARFTSPQAVQLAYQCRNPVACISGQTFSANSINIQSNNNSVAQGSIAYTNVNLNFNSNGAAALPINYSDVGQVRLFARLSLPATASSPAYILQGLSNDFVVRPYSISVVGAQSLSGGANPGTTSSGSGFIAAGEKFRVNLQSLNSNNVRTPNFGNEITSELPYLGLTANSLVYPASGNLTALTVGGYFATTAIPGQFSNADIYWNEVGSITLLPRLLDDDYLGAGNPLMVTSGTVGRFYPSHFTLVSSSVKNSCDSFTYMQQNAMPVSFNIEARNALNIVTTNYGGNYAATNKPVITYVAENNNSGNGASLSSRVLIGTANNWVNGVLNFSNPAASFLRATSPDGPYNQLQFGLQLVDIFDTRSLAGLNMNATTTGDCVSNNTCNAKRIEPEAGSLNLNLLWGRLRLEDAFGPETASLPVNFNAEYWTGSYWATNLLDSCTAINRTAISYPSGSIATDANRTVALNGGSTQGRYNSLTTSQVLFASGSAGHFFTAPGAGTGNFVVRVDLTAYPWFRFDWNQNNNHNDDTFLPNANFGFGSYRGHDRILYWRETF